MNWIDAETNRRAAAESCRVKAAAAKLTSEADQKNNLKALWEAIKKENSQLPENLRMKGSGDNSLEAKFRHDVPASFLRLRRAHTREFKRVIRLENLRIVIADKDDPQGIVTFDPCSGQLILTMQKLPFGKPLEGRGKKPIRLGADAAIQLLHNVVSGSPFWKDLP